MLHNTHTGRHFTLTILLLVLMIVLVAPAGEITFQSKQAKDAQNQYQTKLNEIKKVASTQTARATKQYVAALNDAKKNVQPTDLDEAVRIRDAIKQINDEEKENHKPATQPETPTPRRSLEWRLAGTKWNEQKPGVIWTFNRDGTITTSDGREGKWAAIGETTILSVFSNGWVDQMEFDDKLSTVSDTHAKLGEPWKAQHTD